MPDDSVQGMCLPCVDSKTRDWYAWNDFQPPQPDFFHITGEIYVPNPGVEGLLVPTYPPGINPEILLLDLYICQKPGRWPQAFVWIPVRYSKKISQGYSSAEVLCEGNVIAKVPAERID